MTRLVLIFVVVCFALTGCDEPGVEVYRVAKDPPPPGAGAMAAGEMVQGGEDHDDHTGHDHGPIPTDADAVAPGKLRFATPEDWKTAANASDLLMAAYDIDTSAGPVRVTVSSLSGEAGGVLPNINRWRGQVGLAPVATLGEQLHQTPMIAGQPAILVDLSGPVVAGNEEDGQQRRPRIVSAMFAHQGQMWFFKMTGTHDAVETQRKAFDAFLKSVVFVGVTRNDDAGGNLPAPGGAGLSGTRESTRVLHGNVEFSGDHP